MLQHSPVYLLDAFHSIFRAYYAVRSLANSKGMPTNAVYGFTRMLLKLLKDRRPAYIGAFFDRPEATFRKDLYSAYKANRLAPPEDLTPQIDWVKRVVRDLDIPLIEKPGFEADDLLGTAARHFAALGHPVILVTGDKDLMQLVNDQVRIFDTLKDREFGRDGVVERFGVPPEQVVDVLALAGDSSDNIPGVRGIGEKIAASLIQKYGSLDNLYDHVDEVPGKRGEALRLEKANAYLSKELATIKCDVPWAFEVDEFKLSPPNRIALEETLAILEFKGLGPDLEAVYGNGGDLGYPAIVKEETVGQAPSALALSQSGNYRAILSFEAFAQVLSELEKVEVFAFDTETTGLNPREAEIVGLSLAWKPGEAVYIPLGHDDPSVEQLPKAAVLNSLKPFFENPRWRKIGQNIKFDDHILRGESIRLNGLCLDTMIAAYLLDPESPHNLDALAERYLSYKTIHYEDLAGSGAKAISFAKVPIEKAAPYGAQDADVAYRLFFALSPLLSERGLDRLFNEIEMPVSRILTDMEEAGIKIDVVALATLSRRFEGLLTDLEIDIHREAGEPFNVQSTKQLAKILFEKLGLPVQSKGKTGPSTASDVLETLAGEHGAKIAEHLLSYRETAKLKNTYTDKLPTLVSAKTGRIHTSFNQTVAATGRLSSSDPNLQNIPVRGESGAAIREAFIAEAGKVLLSLDYSQIELRLLAEFSKDPLLIDIFLKNGDCHQMTASRIFGVALEQVTGAERRVGKTVNFATIYGQGPYSLSAALRVSGKEAKRYIDEYFALYREVKPYRDQIIATARDKGFIETLFGRRRYFPDLTSRNRNLVAAAERAAFNAVIQGSAADIVKLAMIHCAEFLRGKEKACRLLLQVHDELVFEVEASRASEFSENLKRIMESVAPGFQIALLVESAFGKNWSEAHP